MAEGAWPLAGILFVALPAILLALAGCTSPYAGVNDTSSIHSFDQCAAAGYPVMESYPARCRTPDGRIFISQMDAFDAYLDTGCTSDSGCTLADSGRGFSCCWIGQCEALDYSLGRWIAVNKTWFDEGRASYCPSAQDCGPAPGCLPKPINGNFTAGCVSGKCVKKPL